MSTFKIETRPEVYFHQLIEILKLFPPFSKLRKRQREVFAEILYHNHILKTDNPQVTQRLVFDYKTKEQIATKLGISKANLYNIYKELRQLGILKENEINPKFRYEYFQYPSVEFKFSGKDSGK
jgi:predicted transcriptional regulator